MSRWRHDWVFPLLARLPTTLPWYLAGWLGHQASVAERATVHYLIQLFAQVFPDRSISEYGAWARQYLDMLACEMVDALAFDRLDRRGGPKVSVDGWNHAQALLGQGRGVILVVNHWDRLLTAPVVLARRGGVRVNVLTMPVHDNPELDPVMRRFLLRKIRCFTTACGGQWRSTDSSMRAIYEDLSRGGVWLILADAWRPEFSRLREHPFLGGMLRLPTGLERLTRTTGAALLQGWTDSDGPTRLRVTFRPLPDDGPAAVDAVIRHLEQQVVTRPWAWWQWGVFNRMWIGPKESV